MFQYSHRSQRIPPSLDLPEDNTSSTASLAMVLYGNITSEQQFYDLLFIHLFKDKTIKKMKRKSKSKSIKQVILINVKTLLRIYLYGNRTFKSIVMNKLKDLVHRFFILFIGIGLVISYNSCVSDKKDKDLISIQTFLERHDGSQWAVIEEDMRIYLILNDDEDKALEVWRSEMGLAQLMSHKECFYYSHETLKSDKVKVLENSNNKLAFTYLENETWTFSRDGERIKLEFKTPDKVRGPIYFSKTTDNIAKLRICPEESREGDSDWRFLK